MESDFSFVNYLSFNSFDRNYVYLITVLIALLTLYILSRNEKSVLKFYIKYFVFSTYFLIFSYVAMIPACLTSRWKSNYKLYGLMIRPLSHLLGFNFEIRGARNMPKENEGAVIVANHQCMMDFFITFYTWYTLSAPSLLIIRKEFFWVWPYGLLMWLCGVVFIDRRPGSKATKQQMEVLCERIRKNNLKIWFFVEGTRNDKRENLLPFKKGAFRMAINAQVPIVPLVISPFYFINWKKKYFSSGRVILTVLDPIPTKNLTEDDVDDLTNKTYELMSKKYIEVKNELPNFIDDDDSQNEHEVFSSFVKTSNSS